MIILPVSPANHAKAVAIAQNVASQKLMSGTSHPCPGTALAFPGIWVRLFQFRMITSQSRAYRHLVPHCEVGLNL